jgi:hypothetical protein
MQNYHLSFKEDLDQLGCGVPGCEHSHHDGIYLHARCHLDAPTWASYREGVLTLTCSRCGRHVDAVAIAARPPARSSPRSSTRPRGR